MGSWSDLEEGVQVATCGGQPQSIEVVGLELLIPPATTAQQQLPHHRQ